MACAREKLADRERRADRRLGHLHASLRLLSTVRLLLQKLGVEAAAIRESTRQLFARQPHDRLQRPRYRFDVSWAADTICSIERRSFCVCADLPPLRFSSAHNTQRTASRICPSA